MKKRVLALFLAGAMVLGLAACGSGDSGESPSQDAGPSQSAEASGEPAQESAPGSAGSAGFKVGAIYINSQNDTAGYTYQHHTGITTAMKNLGLDPDTQLLIVDNIKENDDAVASAIDTLAGQGANIIFGISFGYINAMAAKAEEYPDIAFSHGTGYLCNDTNFNNYFGRIYQARYLAGVAAGLKSVELGNNAVGYVAAWNTEYAETCSGINAFALGVQSVNPEATVYVNEISTWGDEAKEKAAAQALIDTYDCCVISQHCDSAQPQLCAADNGKFGCGYNSDMTEQAPAGHITAAIWHWDVYYETAIKAIMDCADGNGGYDGTKFVDAMGGNVYYAGLKEHMVDTSPVNAATAAPNTEAVMEAVRELIVSGEWDVFSCVKLSYNIGEDGSVEIVKTDADLKDNAGNVIVAAGGPSVEDAVITGSMNYNVEGVVVS